MVDDVTPTFTLLLNFHVGNWIAVYGASLELGGELNRSAAKPEFLALSCALVKATGGYFYRSPRCSTPFKQARAFPYFRKIALQA